MEASVNKRQVAISIAVVLIHLVVGPALVVAAPETAEAWNALGVQHRRSDEPEKALEAFRKAHELAPSARSRGQMGFVAHDLGLFVEAERHLSQALSDEKDPWVVRNRKFLVEALGLARNHLGRLTVAGPPGASIAVGGVPAGTLPLARPLSIKAGDTWVTVTAPGHLPWEQRLTITGGREVRVMADLAREPGPDAPDLSQPNGVTGDRDTTGIHYPAPLDDEPTGAGPWMKAAGWTLTAAGAALAVAAVWAHLTRQPDCAAGERVCNRTTRSSWTTFGLAGGSVIAGVGGVTLLNW